MQGFGVQLLALADAIPSSPLLPILLGGVAAVGVVLIFAGLQRAVDARSESVYTRMIKTRGLQLPEGADPALPRRARMRGGRLRRPRATAYARFDEVDDRSLTARLERELDRADVKITPSEFLIGSIVLMCLGLLLGIALPVGGNILLGILLFFLGWYGPRFWLRRRWLRRQRAFNNQLADMITLMSGALRAGHGLLQGMNIAAQEGPQPSAAEFGRVVRQISMVGLSPDEALNNLVIRMQSPDLELFVNAINVQREVGGNIAELMDTIANTIRERNKLYGEVQVLTAQQQYSGYIIALLPVGLALILAVINPSYILGVFQQTVWCGWTMAGCSAIMIFTGFLAIRKIVNIQV